MIMERPIWIGAREIGDENPVFIVTVIGINQNGDVDLAKDLISESSKASGDAVKFQVFNHPEPGEINRHVFQKVV
jgi:sialic acid synthase SpsE